MEYYQLLLLNLYCSNVNSSNFIIKYRNFNTFYWNKRININNEKVHKIVLYADSKLKIILIDESGVGKTSILLRFTEDTLMSIIFQK